MSETSEARKPWCYDELFESVRQAWDEHDKTCTSLRYLWLGRRGGVTALGDITDCTGCGVTFYNEGVDWVTWDDPDAEQDIYLCDCCQRKTAATGTDG